MNKSLSLADQAEDQVRTWASAAGFVINSAQRDRAGWDHILDLSDPRETHPNANLLNIPSRSLSARVQVKSTYNSKRRIPIALSNWQRAIEDPLPWFYLVLRFAQLDGSLVEVAAVHLDKVLIERVMRHMHSLDESRLRRLHLMRFALTWSDSDLLSESASMALRHRIEEAVPKDLFHYAERKRTWSSDAGWSPTKQMHFTVVAPSQEELYQRLSRAALGLEESIAVSAVRVTRERFGRIIDDPEFPNGTAGQVTIEHGDQDKNWTFGLSDSAGSDELTLPATARFSPAILPGLPEKYWLVRIETPFLDVVMEWATGKLSISVGLPPAAMRVTLRDLAPALQLMTRLMQFQGRKVRFSLTKNFRRTFFSGTVPYFELDEDVKRIAYQAEQVSAALRALRVDSEPMLSSGAIEALAPMAQLIVAAHERQRMDVQFETTIPATLDVPSRVALLTNAYLPVGDFFYIQLVLVKGSPEMTDVNGERKLLVKSNDISAHSLCKVHKDDVQSFPLAQKADDVELELQRSEGIGLVIIHDMLRPQKTAS